MTERIDVNQPFLPPLHEYQAYLSDIWQRKWLTNDGDLLRELEHKLEKYLGVEHIKVVSNGTVALQLAINSLDLSGSIITTAFSYVATSTAICWQNCRPVFVDIDPETLNINASLIEAAITEDTQAILATHVFGTPCDISAIDRVAKKHGLKVIYDAAHCFGVRFRNKSIFEYGDISCISFHATKVYHCVEGGAVVACDKDLVNRIRLKRNFGHHGPYQFSEIGINGKQSEVHAAMGLCNLLYMDEVLQKRRSDSFRYFQLLDGLNISYPKIPNDTEPNYGYFPIILETEGACLQLLRSLEEKNIFCRRYFYPALSSLDIFEKQPCYAAESISKRVLCLPLYYELQAGQIDYIGEQVRRVLEPLD